MLNWRSVLPQKNEFLVKSQLICSNFSTDVCKSMLVLARFVLRHFLFFSFLFYVGPSFWPPSMVYISINGHTYFTDYISSCGPLRAAFHVLLNNYVPFYSKRIINSSWSQAGFDPPLAECAESTEWETDTLANRATTAGSTRAFFDWEKLSFMSFYTGPVLCCK